MFSGMILENWLKKSCLNHCLRKITDGNASYKRCWELCKVVLTLLHWKVVVQRGFSDQLSKISEIPGWAELDYR